MKVTNQVVLQSLGAAGTVTGSKHLLKTPELTILVDCGLFQGLKSLRLKNWDTFPIDPAIIDVLLLTHAHLDHCGYIPLLIKNGFKGKVFMTPPTADLAEIILRDSAKIQEEDAQHANEEGYSQHKPALPLYTVSDVETALTYFKCIDQSVDTKLSSNISFKFRKNGHILGSCCIELSCYGKQIVFSGDIGRYNSKFMLPPENVNGADYVIMESTYGDRLHPKEDPSEQLATTINETILKHGNVLIPSFAVGRAQEVMNVISDLKLNGKIRQSVPVYLDSPMAADTTDLLNKYPQWHKLSREQCDRVCKDIIINRDYHNTKHIISSPGSKIVIAASGMLTGGRVLEYVKHYIGDPNNTILLIGYQAEGTRGRALQNKAHEIKLHGRFYPVRAEVCEIAGMSAHGDQNELLQWIRSFKKSPQKIFLVHGEPGSLDALRIKIEAEFKIPVQIQEEGRETVLYNINK